jgi:hypothetical protein
MLESMESYSLALFTRVLGWSSQEVHVFLTGVRQEIMDRHIHVYKQLPLGVWAEGRVSGRRWSSRWSSVLVSIANYPQSLNNTQQRLRVHHPKETGSAVSDPEISLSESFPATGCTPLLRGYRYSTGWYWLTARTDPDPSSARSSNRKKTYIPRCSYPTSRLMLTSNTAPADQPATSASCTSGFSSVW